MWVPQVMVCFNKLNIQNNELLQQSDHFSFMADILMVYYKTDCGNSIADALDLNDHSLALSQWYINGSVQDCSNSSANALELLQSCTEPSYMEK